MNNPNVCAAVAGEEEEPTAGTSLDFSTLIVVAGIIGATIVLAVAVIVCGVVYIQKYKYVSSVYSICCPSCLSATSSV